LLGVILVLAATIAHSGKPGESPGRTRTTVERMSLDRLAAAHADVLRYQAGRRTPPAAQSLRGLHDYRAVLHVHAEDSAHTGGTLAELLQGARKAGVHVVSLTDHFPPRHDFMNGWRGVREGVLFIPGAEARGFLFAPERSIVEVMDGSLEDLVTAARAGSGMVFLSHVEERAGFSTSGLTGMEIYNRHADAEDDQDLEHALADWSKDPVKLAELEQALERYPDEVFASQLDYPRLYLAKWDRDTQARRLVGIAANDSHHNHVFTANVSGKTVRLDFDPYDRSFRNVSTHILAEELTEPAIRRALSSGHAYVSHDWMCDPTGFQFHAETNDPKSDVILGDEADATGVTTLVARFPVGCAIRLLKDGARVADRSGTELEHRPDGPGVYRVEGWLNVDGEERVWIISNPIYLR
jgi:hypothetical protein